MKLEFNEESSKIQKASKHRLTKLSIAQKQILQNARRYLKIKRIISRNYFFVGKDNVSDRDTEKWHGIRKPSYPQNEASSNVIPQEVCGLGIVAPLFVCFFLVSSFLYIPPPRKRSPWFFVLSFKGDKFF